MTEFPTEQPTGFPVETDPDVRTDPETEPGVQGEPDFDLEPDREASHPVVEEAMQRLEDLRERPVAEHAEVYADLQDRLQDALAEADRTATWPSSPETGRTSWRARYGGPGWTRSWYAAVWRGPASMPVSWSPRAR